MAIRFPIPRATPMLQLHHLGGGFADEGFDRILITQPVAPGNRVVRVLIQAVARLDHCRRAAFGRNGVAAHRINLGDHGDGEAGKCLSHGNGGAQPRPTAADDQHIAREDVHRFLRRSAAGVRPGSGSALPLGQRPDDSAAAAVGEDNKRIADSQAGNLTSLRRSLRRAGVAARASAWRPHLTG